MEFELVLKHIKPNKEIQTKIKHVNTILKEINTVIPKNFTLFKLELEILRNETMKYLRLVDDPLDEIVRILYSTVPDVVDKFDKNNEFKKVCHYKELFGNFFEDDGNTL